MDTSLFAQINTTLSVRESKLLDSARFEQLLASPDRDSMALLLQDTAYGITAEDLANPNRIEERLLKDLAETYRFAFEEAPVQAIVQLFTLRYTYHNVKVLLKARATKQELSALLLPIGAYSIEVLENLVATLTSEACPELMVTEVAATWSEYEAYQDVRVLDVGMDMAYFKHLKMLADELDHPLLSQFVALTIDGYNVITIKRGLVQEKSNGFMRQLLSDDALLKAREYLSLFEDKSLLSWFNQVYPMSYDTNFESYEVKLEQADISAVELEYLLDILRFQVLEEGCLDSQGPVPLARYLYGKELEVQNLRLILTGRSNGLSIERLRERMRPIYGQ